MKKRYFLILSLILLMLSISYVNAKDVNSTDNNPILKINETNYSNSNIKSCVKFTNSSTDPSINDDVPYKEPTKKQRTFKIGKFKGVLSKKQYKKLFLISSVEKEFKKLNKTNISKFKGYQVKNGGLFYSTAIKTNNYVIKKIRISSPVVTYPDKIKFKYKKVPVFMSFNYDTSKYDRVRGGYTIKLFDGEYWGKIIGKNDKYFNKCKYSKSFSELKKSKLIKYSKVFKIIPFVVNGHYAV